MNQSLLNSSGNRQNRKRNSHESIKASFTFKHPKKQLPQVSIDLNQHQKKTKLALNQRNNKIQEFIAEKQFLREPSNIGKSCKKKDQIILNQLFNTQKLITNGQKKNALSEYRQQIQTLKMQNQKLREQNQRLRKNEQYLSRRLNQQKAQNLINESQLKEYTTSLQTKLEKYTTKIKELFEELIKIKKSRLQEENQKYHEKTTHSGLSNNDLNRYKNIRQPYTYRLKDYNVEGSRWKRMTSPSSHDRQKINWAEQQIDNLIQFQRRGQQAYYRLEKGIKGTFHSDYN